MLGPPPSFEAAPQRNGCRRGRGGIQLELSRSMRMMGKESMGNNANDNHQQGFPQSHNPQQPLQGAQRQGYGYPEGVPQIRNVRNVEAPSSKVHSGEVPGSKVRSGEVRNGDVHSNNVRGEAAPAPQAVLIKTVEKKKGRGPGFWIPVIIACLAVVACVIFGVISLQDSAGVRDPNVSAGQIEGKTPDEIQAELDRVVEEGMFNIGISGNVKMQNGEEPAKLLIENVPGNRYLMRVTITRDDNGEEIYKSGIIEPNYHIQEVKLDKVLPKGDYKCTAIFEALDPDTEEQVGTAAAQIDIHVYN